MTKFKNDAEVSKYALESDLPTELHTRLSHSALLVGTVRDGIPSARACVILSKTEREHDEILREYRLSDALPEDSEDFTAGGRIWRRQTYILDDAGDGIICFYPLPPR